MRFLGDLTERYAVHFCPAQECLSRTFQDSACGISRWGVINRTTGDNLPSIIQSLHHHDLLCITENSDIWIMGYDNNLTPFLRGAA